jgi:hypothetical protein
LVALTSPQQPREHPSRRPRCGLRPPSVLLNLDTASSPETSRHRSNFPVSRSSPCVPSSCWKMFFTACCVASLFSRAFSCT